MFTNFVAEPKGTTYMVRFRYIHEDNITECENLRTNL